MSLHVRSGARPPRAAVLAATSVLLAGAAVVSVPTAASAATTVTPVADTYVDAERPTSIYGTRTYVYADADPERIAYLRFEVQGEGTPGTAQLRIFPTSTNKGITVHAVSDTTWSETATNYNNRPALGVPIASTGKVTSGEWVEIDVSSHIRGDGVYTLALTTTDGTALRMGTREGVAPPELVVPAPSPPSAYTVTRDGDTYHATSTAAVITGTLKQVVEAAARDLDSHSGGTITFTAGEFDLGNSHLELDDIDFVTFAGQGVQLTTIRNYEAAATDTEVFDIVGADHMVIRDMTISAGGPERSTSDAIDFDNGRNSTIERVKITQSRGRGIVFDGKGVGWDANGNVVRNCVVENVPGDGIELLGSSNNLIEGCTVTNSGGHGIQITKASTNAAVPNKQSNGNTLRNNTVVGSGRDGININSGDANILTGNTLRNSSQASSGRDGIRIESFDGISCNANRINFNTATDNQATPTQTYGVNIASTECTATWIGTGNTFSGNRLGDLNDNGTATEYAADTKAPTTPAGVVATAPSYAKVVVNWLASSDNVGVTGYTVYRDGGVIGTVDGSTLTFEDTTVIPATTYAYTVSATDGTNSSPQSSPPALVTTPSAPSNLTVVAEADAFVDSTSPTTNYGSWNQLRTDGSPLVRAFVRFSVVRNGGPIGSAVVRIKADSSHTAGFELRSVSENGWDEATITDATAPAVGALVGSSGSTTAGQYVEIDVSSIVTQDGTYTFAVTPLNSTNLRLSSREAAQQPQLVVAD